MEYRNLTAAEVAELQAAGCRAEDWAQVYTSAPETLKYIKNVRFSGEVRFGKFEAAFVLPGGLNKHSGLRDCTLHNVTVGDNTLVENISDYIANYNIGHDCYIENVDLLYTDGNCPFGNGVEVSVLNETGGREVKIYDRLSAQTAYILAMYRHQPELMTIHGQYICGLGGQAIVNLDLSAAGFVKDGHFHAIAERTIAVRVQQVHVL